MISRLTSRRLPSLGILTAGAACILPSAHAQTSCNALELKQHRSFVRVAHDGALVPNRITVEAWIQLASNFPRRGTIVRKNTSTGREAWLMRIEDRRLNFSVRGARSFVATLSTTTIQLNTPTHVAATWDGSTTRLYINGAPAGSRSARVGPLSSSAGDMRIGHGNLTSIEQFVGLLDEIRIWNTVRTATDIARFRTRIVSGLPGQVASYSFDRSLRDSSGDFDGTFIGVAHRFQPLRGAAARLAQLNRGPKDGSSFALKVRRLGDVDGDGYEDYSIAQTNGLNGGSQRGALRIHSGFDHRQLFAFQGDRDGNRFGFDSDGGDIDGDGVPEILVGEPGHGNNRGRIWVIDGKTGSRRVLAQGSGADSFGAAVRAMPYLDTDGRCDLITTQGDEVLGLRANGTVLWSRTPSSGKPVTALDGIGDVTGDGLDDFICGVPTHRSNHDNEGLARIGSGRSGASLHRVVGGRANSRFGTIVAGVQGDLDGDRIPDFVAGSPFSRDNRGSLSVRSGKTRARIYATIFGENTSQLLGLAITAARGDLTGDGVPDMWVTRRNGQQGRVMIFDARRGTFGGFVVSPANSPTFGRSIAGLNTNGDTRPDILVGQTGVLAQVLDRCPADRAPSHQTYGAICRGTSSRHPRLGIVDKMRARVNSTYTMRVAAARPDSVVVMQLGAGRTNVPLDAIGMNGCRSLVARPILSLLSGVDGNGYADVAIRVPDDVSLSGSRLNFQGICLDQGANAAGLTATNGAEVVHGSKL